MGGLSSLGLVFWTAFSVAAFQLAVGIPAFGPLILGWLFGLLQLSRARTGRQAFYAGLAAGFLACAPQLGFFWGIFGPGAIVLWLVLASWIGLFALMGRSCHRRLDPKWELLWAPVLWTGLEYTRSEIYHLRFSWLTAGSALRETLPSGVFALLGVYGVGFVAMAIVAALRPLGPRRSGFLLLAVAAAVVAPWPTASIRPVGAKSVIVAGAQLEFPTDDDVLRMLKEMVQRVPAAEILVLSEYTFQDTVPSAVKRWCRENNRYLVVGGKDPAGGPEFYNTAFVVGPAGDIVFRQAKRRPIQFFKDGLPAPEQRVWDSPWGEIGICICYDLSYRRVTDPLVRLGAQALIAPTMDVADWGKREHELNAIMGPMRAKEHRIPVFRVASSGVSQLIDATGRVTATAGFPGERAILAGRMELGRAGSRPVDSWLAPVAAIAVVSGLVVLFGRRKRFEAVK
jgi:apolipoprotein N-acyltransferase